jgi:hypothetical protein
MDTAVILDEPHFKLVAAKARALGKTPEQYIQSLIDADSRTFDEILEPVRKGFESMSDDDVDGLSDRAKKAARQPEALPADFTD